MAARRMISKDIFDSDVMTDLPPTARLLWCSFVIHADDDGIVDNPNNLCKAISASKGDIQLLLDAELVLITPDYPRLVVVTDWLRMNKIQPTRKQSSQYDIVDQLNIKKGRYSLSTSCRQLTDNMSHSIV